MALLSLTNGTTWKGSQGLTPGYTVTAPPSFGTLGSVPFWRRRKYTAPYPAWSGFGDPTKKAYNVASSVLWHAVVNNTQQQPISPANPPNPVTFSPVETAALLKG